MLVLQDLYDFSIDSWYKPFENICIKSYFIAIPDTLLAQLKSGDSDYELEKVCSEQFINNIKNVLHKLKYDAFVKNNWHAPMDAKFISFGNSLKVTNLNDILLYFTASDIVTSDFQNVAYKSFNIVLKPWLNIHPASEFRCIVINNVLRGISPRDWPTYYEHFKEEGSNVINNLTKFFNENIKGKFSRKTYVFDVITAYENDITLLDFGPLNAKTNLYAFTWKEIQPLINKECPAEVPPVFRYLETDLGIMTRSDALKKIRNSMDKT